MGTAKFRAVRDSQAQNKKVPDHVRDHVVGAARPETVQLGWLRLCNLEVVLKRVSRGLSGESRQLKKSMPQ